MLETLLSLGLLIAASIFDIKTRKIPNSITFSSMAFGILHTIACKHENIFSICVAFCVLFIIGCFRIMGWGDIKCLMALTAITNWKLSLFCFLLSQLLMVGHYFLRTPNEALKDIKHSVMQIDQKHIQIDQNGRKKVMAPYLLIAYIVISAFSIIF